MIATSSTSQALTSIPSEDVVRSADTGWRTTTRDVFRSRVETVMRSLLTQVRVCDSIGLLTIIRSGAGVGGKVRYVSSIW